MKRVPFVLKAEKLPVLWALILALSLFASTGAYAQITPSADSYTNTADATTNYGSKTLLDVDAASQITYIQFNLASIPSGTNISQATLKLYVNGVTTAGSFNVDYINSAWSENTIDASNAPPLGSNIASNVNVTVAEKNQYILINVTSAVQAWLSGSETNNGLALVANSTFNATFDSKENTTTSHPPELDVAYAGGEGTITGVTTASGSGLSGGGTSGTLNLSLTNTCASNQVLQWNGTVWACASAGTGTITGVTAGTNLTGGGSSGSVTLNLDTTKVPQLAWSNSFTGSNVFEPLYSDAIDAYSSNPGSIAVRAQNLATSGGSYGVYATTSDSSVAAVNAVNNALLGTGVFGGTGTGTGVSGVVYSGTGVSGATDFGNGVFGSATSGYGVYGTASSSGYDGVHGETSNAFSGVAGINHSTGGYGVYGEAQGLEGYGAGFINSLGGWAGYFQGNVDVVGSLSKSGGSFKIDDPLDPANKYLYHSFVESPDMKNMYDGVATLDANGEATVEMPDWFDVLNRDFRYQLTCIGGFAPVYIAEELSNNQFKIGGGRAGMRISWQITGVRQDPWANAHRIPVEEEKEEKLKGFYLHPELYGAPAEKQIEWARHPQMMKKLHETTEQIKEKQAGLTESIALPETSK